VALYDYYCETNDRTVEVRHGMSEVVKTWGELCEMAGIETGDTPADAPLRKLMGAPVPMTRGSTGSSSGPACGTSGCCPYNG
jgi:hypothetical protein